MSDGTGLAEKLLGLDGFRVLEVLEGPDELVIAVETTMVVTGCRACGTRAVADERMPVAIRDLADSGEAGQLLEPVWSWPERTMPSAKGCPAAEPLPTLSQKRTALR